MDWGALLEGTREAVSALVSLLITGVAVFLGALFVYKGVAKMLAHARGERQGQNTVGPVVGHLLIGALLLQFSFSVSTISNTLFNENAGLKPNAALAYMPPHVAGNKFLVQMIEVGLLWVYFIGFVAILRGFVLWHAMVSGDSRGQDNGWKGFWHLFFGAMAVNITGVVKMLTSGGG